MIILHNLKDIKLWLIVAARESLLDKRHQASGTPSFSFWWPRHRGAPPVEKPFATCWLVQARAASTPAKILFILSDVSTYLVMVTMILVVVTVSIIYILRCIFGIVFQICLLPISSLLGVQYSTSHDLDLQVACCIWSALPGHLHLVTELCLKFLLDLAELGGVPSSTTINDVDLKRHGCRSATAAASQVAGPAVFGH